MKNGYKKAQKPCDIWDFCCGIYLGCTIWLRKWDLKGPACGTRNSMLTYTLAEFRPLRLVGLSSSRTASGRFSSPFPPAEAWNNFISQPKRKRHPIGCLLFCLKRVKRCLNRCKNEQKVSNIFSN